MVHAKVGSSLYFVTLSCISNRKTGLEPAELAKEQHAGAPSMECCHEQACP